MTAGLAAANKISMAATVAAVLSKLDGNFALKEERRMALKAFIGGKEVALLLT